MGGGDWRELGVFDLEGSLAVQVFEEVAFVGLIPTEFPGGDGPEIEAVDVAAGHEGALEFFVVRDGGAYERGADGFGDFGSGALYYAGVGEEEFTVGQGVVAIAVDDRGKQPGNTALLNESGGAANGLGFYLV